MKISENNRNILYASIADEIMKLRIEVGKEMVVNDEWMDEKLFDLQQKIWNRIKKNLNMKD